MLARSRHALIAIGLGALALTQIAPAQAVPMLKLDDGNGPLGPFSGAFSGSGSPFGPLSVSGPFSITQVVTITHSATSSSTSLNAEVYVPEPGTLAVLGFGLVMLGFTHRQRAYATA